MTQTCGAWLPTVVIEVPAELAWLLDAGEAATIALAQLQTRLVLLDGRRGRRVARERGLPIIGTGAMLLEAKRQGLLPAVAPVLYAMVAQGRYISERLRLALLEEPGSRREKRFTRYPGRSLTPLTKIASLILPRYCQASRQQWKSV